MGSAGAFAGAWGGLLALKGAKLGYIRQLLGYVSQFLGHNASNLGPEVLLGSILDPF